MHFNPIRHGHGHLKDSDSPGVDPRGTGGRCSSLPSVDGPVLQGVPRCHFQDYGPPFLPVFCGSGTCILVTRTPKTWILVTSNQKTCSFLYSTLRKTQRRGPPMKQGSLPRKKCARPSKSLEPSLLIASGPENNELANTGLWLTLQALTILRKMLVKMVFRLKMDKKMKHSSVFWPQDLWQIAEILELCLHEPFG